MNNFIDARRVASGTVLQPDIVIVGAGPTGITLALALAKTGLKLLLIESGGMNFDPKTQAMYDGARTGVPYLPLDGSRLRYLGGSSNHWGGWCRPLDPLDFESRDWLDHSGWPFGISTLEPYFARAQAMVEAGSWIYDRADKWIGASGPKLPLGSGGVYTSWFQFSKMRNSVLPTHFGERYSDDLKHAAGVSVYLHANVAGLRLAHDAASLDHIEVATLSGNRFIVKPRYAVLAAGAMENARLLLASNDVAATGIGNGNDLVGRFFADHPIPRDTATLVVFDGKLASFYGDSLTTTDGTILRATFAPTQKFLRDRQLLSSLTTVENAVELDAFGKAAVTATADALGVAAHNAKAYSLGCGMELAPDPERRLTLTHEKDALGIPKLKLTMRVSDSDIAHHRETMKELGRQLLAARSGMIRLDLRNRDQWEHMLDWGNHHLGTARMSDDPKKGVVDANLKLHGVANLFVAGSSAFPTYGSSNPTMNLLALTLRLADHMKELFA